MFYPILLSMIAAAAGVPANGPEPTIRVTLNNDGQYLPGDRSKVQVITRDDGYLLVFQVNPDGRLRVLFPLDPTDDNYVKGGKRYLLLGRGGREGFTVDAPGSGVVFAAVSLDPWRFSGYVQNDHWDSRVLNTTTYDDTEPQLVALAQGMAGGRFDYDVVGYTVASQVAVTEDPLYTSSGVGVVDGCFGCDVMPASVIYSSGYYDTGYYSTGYYSPGYYNGIGLYDPYYYSPYYYYGPYYPTWAYGPACGWWCWNGGYWHSGYWGNYYPPFPTAIPYAPYQQKQWDRTWSGAPVPYRPRGAYGYTATNTVVGAVPGIGVQQHASFRNRTWSGGGTVAGASVVKPSAVPVSKSGSSGARRRDASPATSPTRSASGSAMPSGLAAPTAVPSRQRAQAAVKPYVEPFQGRPEARPSGGASGRRASERPTAVAAPMPAVGTSPFERRMPMPSGRPSQSATVPPVSRTAPEAVPSATKATGEGRSSEPVLRRREPPKPAASQAPAPTPRQESGGQRDPSLGRSYGSPPPSQPSGGSTGGPTGGWSGGGGGRATSSPPSSQPSSPPPSAVSGGGGGRRR